MCSLPFILGNDTTAQNDWQGSWWHSSLSHHSGKLTGYAFLLYRVYAFLNVSMLGRPIVDISEHGQFSFLERMIYSYKPSIEQAL